MTDYIWIKTKATLKSGDEILRTTRIISKAEDMMKPALGLFACPHSYAGILLTQRVCNVQQEVTVTQPITTNYHKPQLTY